MTQTIYPPGLGLAGHALSGLGPESCLATLADRLIHHLPICPTGAICARPIPVNQVDGQYVATLPTGIEFGTLTLYGANGVVTQLNQTGTPQIDYITGKITFPTNPGPYVVIDYQVSLAEEFILQAVADLGRRLPRKLTTHFITNATGVTPLPEGLSRILSLCRIDCGCTCQESTCAAPCGTAPCFRCHHCATYIDSGNLIQADGTCEVQQFDLCYLSAYTLDKYGCFNGLTAELADLVIYKALSLAYRNPQMLLAITGLSINRNSTNSSSSGSSGSGSSSNTETTTTIKTKDNCGKEEKTVTTKTGSSSSTNLSSSTASTLSGLFSSSSNSGLADQYEALYLAGISRRTNFAALRLAPQHRGYRARFAGYC